MSANESTGTWTAPYTVWKTLENLIEKMGKEGSIPGRIDRSYLSHVPGGAQSELQTAMKSLGLVDDEFRPTDLLGRLVNDTDGRAATVREMLEERYAAALALGNSATQAQLEEVFREKFNVSGSTLRKAVRFFMNAAKYADMTLSPHYTAPGAGTGQPRKRKPRSTTNGTPAAQQQPPAETPKTTGLHPFIEGLVSTLPKPGAAFPEAKQEAWFDTARGIFRLIYTTDEAAAPAAPEPFVPMAEDGDDDD